jgi:hypothetical protein
MPGAEQAKCGFWHYCTNVLRPRDEAELPNKVSGLQSAFPCESPNPRKQSESLPAEMLAYQVKKMR